MTEQTNDELIEAAEQRGVEMTPDDTEALRQVERDDPIYRALVAHMKACPSCKESGRTGNRDLACQQGRGLAETYKRANG